MEQHRKYKGGALKYAIFALLMVLIIYISYYALKAQYVSLAIYSLILAIFGGAFFFFVQRLYSIKYEETIEKLSLVPEIKNLINEAEEKKEELKKLEQIVEFSASKYYLNKRYGELEDRLNTTYDEMMAVKKEIESLKIDIHGKLSQKKIEEIENYIGYRERGDIIIQIGKRRIVIPKDLFNTYPFGIFGLLLMKYLELLNQIKKKKKKNGN